MAHRRFTPIVAALVVIATSLPDAAPEFSDWSAPVNLGATVNSSVNDLGPALSKDGLSLYFQSGRPGGFGAFDLWVSQRETTEDPWGQPVNLGPVINTASVEGAPSFSRDGHLMFFNSNRPGGFGDTDIWVSWREHVHDDFDWQPPVNLGAGVNTSFGDGGATFFANDATGVPLLFFGSSRPGGPAFGNIYVAALAADGSFDSAALVPELSSPQDDMGPRIRFDGLEFFQSSNRIGGVGLRDFWVSLRDSVFEPWSPPENLGSVVNSTANELTPYLSSDRRYLVFASDRAGGSGLTDLYVTARVRENRGKAPDAH
jgi:hypothetical protein